MPPLPKAIRPHPHGVELGVLLKMLADTKARTVRQFLTQEFSRVSPRVAKEISTRPDVEPDAKPDRLGGEEAKAIYEAIQQTKIMAPATDCVVPIGEEQLVSRAASRWWTRSFTSADLRSPAVYRGNPFIIEAALAYGRPEASRQPPEGEHTGWPAPASPAIREWLGTGRCPRPRPRPDEEDDEDQQLAKPDAVRQPRAAALPAVRLRHLQIRRRP